MRVGGQVPYFRVALTATKICLILYEPSPINRVKGVAESTALRQLCLVTCQHPLKKKDTLDKALVVYLNSMCERDSVQHFPQKVVPLQQRAILRQI